MKVWKKLTALVLCAACVCALAAVPPASAAEAVSTFPDVTDPQVGRAVEALRTMGVLDGSGGYFNPSGSLTRAQFCKMAILVMGRGGEADAQASRTIFNDVPGSHWARGYVNLAALTTVGGEEDKGGSRLMMGLGNGSFAPDRPITYGEAVTAVLRILGYTKEANFNWPYGAVASAAAVGLDSGFTAPKAGDNLTRAQAALLFCNMLTTPVSGGKDTTYLKSLGYTVKTGALLLAGDTAQNGRSGYVKVFTGDEQTDQLQLPAVRNPASFLEGTRGTAVYDQNGRFFTFLPDAGATSKTITVASTSGGVLTATDGTKYTPSISTQVWNGGSTSEEYAKAYTGIRPGTSITVCFTEAGTIDYLFVHGTAASLTGGVMVARDKVSGNPFAQLTAGTVDYKIVKNGVEVTTSALQQYDVAAFDPSNKTLYVTDFRLTGVYESASPNTSMPTKIRLSLIGKELDVLDSAVEDLKNLKLNSTVTLLFSPDGKVAGAVSASTLRSNTVGWVDEASYNDTGDVTVNLLWAPTKELSTIKGPITKELSALSPDDISNDTLNEYTKEQFGKTLDEKLSELVKRDKDNWSSTNPNGEFDAEKSRAIWLQELRSSYIESRAKTHKNSILTRLNNYRSSLVTVSGSANGIINLSRLNGKKVSDTLNLKTRALGNTALADNVAVFEKVGNSDIKQISLANITVESVPAKKIVYQRTNAAGKVDILLLDDVTGDLYTYGMAEIGKTGMGNHTTTVTNSEGENGGNSSLPTVGGTSYNKGQFIGLVPSITTVDSHSRAADSVLLKSVEKVSLANFNLNTMLFFSGSIELPISEDVQCYNAQTKTWFGAGTENSAMDNLRACLAYSSSLTVYYDRDPAQGGKVRVVAAN